MSNDRGCLALQWGEPGRAKELREVYCVRYSIRYNQLMANKGAGRSILVPVLLINSAVLALLLLVCQTIKDTSPLSRHAPAIRPGRVAGTQVIRLTGQSVRLGGYGKVSGSGAFRLQGTGTFSVISNGGVATVNGALLPIGRIMQVVEPTSFVIEGNDIYAQVSGSPFSLFASGTGTLSPDVEVPTEVSY